MKKIIFTYSIAIGILMACNPTSDPPPDPPISTGARLTNLALFAPSGAYSVYNYSVEYKTDGNIKRIKSNIDAENYQVSYPDDKTISFNRTDTGNEKLDLVVKRENNKITRLKEVQYYWLTSAYYDIWLYFDYDNLGNLSIIRGNGIGSPISTGYSDFVFTNELLTNVYNVVIDATYEIAYLNYVEDSNKVNTNIYNNLILGWDLNIEQQPAIMTEGSFSLVGKKQSSLISSIKKIQPGHPTEIINYEYIRDANGWIVTQYHRDGDGGDTILYYYSFEYSE